MNIFSLLGLRARIYTIITTLVLITFSGGMVMVWYTYRIEGMFGNIIDKNITAFQVVEELETALLNQEGFVTYFLLDSDPDWLRQLGEYRQLFRERLEDAGEFTETSDQKKTLKDLESEYNKYIEIKDRVIESNRDSDIANDTGLHKIARAQFFRSLDLCENFKNLYVHGIVNLRNKSLVQAINLRIIAVTAIICVVLLGTILIFVLVKQVLEPVRLLVKLADREKNSPDAPNEVKALSKSVRRLINDIDQTSQELDKSRETLLQAEKMAMVGKLAGGVAHSIRNPLTSVKMRLFSMGRAMAMPPAQKEDFDVISEEINHIEAIIRNFLEFSRPPRLKVQMISPSEVVDLILHLLRYRLESGDLTVVVHRKKPLPQIQIDPEQIREVLVSLIINACEAMGNCGQIDIYEEEGRVKDMGDVVFIRLADNGPGIPNPIKEKIFQPFFTTKEEGTGLGLAIAERIIKKHRGSLRVESREGKGTTFIITLLR